MNERDPHIDEDVAGDGDGVASDAGGDRDEAARPARRRRLRRVLRVLGWIGVVLAVLLFTVVIVLQTEWGRQQVKDLVVSRLDALVDGAHFEVGDLGGNVIGRLELTDVVLVKDPPPDAPPGAEAERLAFVDTLRAGYNLLALVRNRLHLHRIDIVDPYLWVEQGPDGTWDLARVFARDDSVAIDTAGAPLAIELDRLELVRGGLTARFYSPQGDSVLAARKLLLRLGDARFGDALDFEVDTLFAEVQLPEDSTWLNLAAAGALTDRAFALDGLRLTSPDSDVRGVGTLRLPESEDDVIDDVDFRLSAQPLAFDDLRPIVPALAPGTTVRLEGVVEGSERALRLDLDALFSTGGSVEAEGVVSPYAEGPLRYDLAVAVRDLDPAALVTGLEARTAVSATFDVDLAGETLDGLDGTIEARVYDARYDTYTIDDLRLDADVQNGAAEVALTGLVNETALTSRGVVRPFDEIPYYNLRGRVAGLDAQAFTAADGGFTTDVTATYRVQGYGFDPKTSEIEASVDLASSTINRYRIEDGRVALALENGRLVTTARLLSPSGDLLADATVTFGDVLSYTVERASLEDFDLSAFTGADVPSSIYARFSLRGQGTEGENITLRADAQVSDSRYGDLSIPAATATANVQQGRLNFDVSADFAEAGELALAGRGRPFAPRPTLSIDTGTFTDLDLGPFASNPELETRLTGTTEFALQGFDLATAALDGALTLRDSRVNEQPIQDALADVQLRNGRLTFGAEAQFPEGAVEVAGSARPFGASVTYTVDRGVFRGIDVGAFTGNPDLATDLTGTFSLDGRGTDPRSAVVDARLDLAPSTINEQALSDLYGTLSLQRGDLGFDLFGALPGGSLRLRGTGDFLADVPTYTLREGRFARLDLGALLGNPDLETDLTGTLALDGRGTDPATLALDGRLVLDDSRINAQLIDSAAVVVATEGGRLVYEASVLLPEGAAELAGTAQPFLDVPTYAVEEGTFRGIDVGAFTGNPDLETRLAGALTLEGRGFDPDSLVLTAQLALEPSLVNDARLVDGLLAVDVDGGFAEVAGRIDFEDGRAEVEAEGRLFDEVPTYRAEGRLVNVDLDALAGIDTLSAEATARFALEGRGFDPETLTLEGVVEADTTRFGRVFVSDLTSSFRLADGLLALDTLAVRSNVLDATAEGVATLFDSTRVAETDLTFEAEIKDLSALEDLLGIERLEAGQGRIAGTLVGQPDGIRFNVATDLTAFAYNDIRLSGLDGRVAGEYSFETGLRLGEGRLELSTVALPGLTIRGSDLEVVFDGEEIAFEGEFVLDERRDARLAGRIDTRPDARRIRIEDLDIRFDEDEWELLTEAVITYGDEYRVSNFLLFADDQQIAIDGVVDPDGMQNLVVTIESFRIGAVADLLGYEGLNGTLNGALDLTGPYYAPNATGALDFDLASFGEPVGDLDLDLTYDSLRLAVEGLLSHEDGSTLGVQGFVPLDLRLAPAPDTTVIGGGVSLAQREVTGDEPVRLTIDADSFSVDWIEPFLDPQEVSRLDGRLEADVLVTGTLGAPVLEGDAALIDGYAALPILGLAYEDIAARLAFEDNTVVLSDAVLRSGGGTLRAEGTIDLAELTLGEFDIQARLDNFRAIESPEYEASASGAVTLSGTTRRPVLTGSLDVFNADIYLTEANTGGDIEIVELTDDDLRMLEERFNYRVTEEDTSTFVFYEALTMDLSVEIERDTWIRQSINPELALQVQGRLDLQKEPLGELGIFGTIETIEQGSYIEQFGRRFSIREGTIVFNGGPLDFIVDVSAAYAVRQRRSGGEEPVVIILNVDGRIDELELTFASENPSGLPLTDIISYIAVGRPAGQFQFGGGQGGVLGQGAGLALGQLAGIVEGVAAERLGLDVVEIRQEGLRGTVIVFGRYVHPEFGPYRPNVYVAVEQPISFTTQTETGGTTNQAVTRLLIELEVFEWLLLRAAGGKEALELNLLWEYAY